MKLWDPATGALLAEHETGNAKTARSLAFSIDGRTIYYGLVERIGRLDATTLEPLPPLPGEVLVAASPDGVTLAVGAPKSGIDTQAVDLWDLPSGRSRARLLGHTSELYYFAFSPDGRTLATANWDGTVRLWHSATGEELMTIRRQMGVAWAVAFAPDGRSMAIGMGTAGVRELTLWDARPPTAAASGP